jgi:hypothetical protein
VYVHRERISEREREIPNALSLARWHIYV